MTTKVVRKIVQIDEDKCDGCGQCVPACAEGAIEIINGKARLIEERFCDGLGACIGECPQDALRIETREADDFDETVLEKDVSNDKQILPFESCPSVNITNQLNPASTFLGSKQLSRLSHWPIQIRLVPPRAPFLKGSNLLVAADCAPFACANFHEEYLKDHALLIGCPKLDDYEIQLERLIQIFNQSSIKSVKVVRMEVPCCYGLTHMTSKAIKNAGRDVPLKEIVLDLKGELKQ